MTKLRVVTFLLMFFGVAPAVRAGSSIEWTFANAQFNDGGALTGSFIFDTTTATVTDWSIDAGIGTDPSYMFPDFLYTPASSSLTATIDTFEAFLDFCTPESSVFGITTINYSRCLNLDVIFPPVPSHPNLSSIGELLPLAPGVLGGIGSYESGLPDPLMFFIDLGPGGIVPFTEDLPSCGAPFGTPTQDRCLHGVGGELEITSALVGSAVPEPATLTLTGLGLAGVVRRSRRRRAAR